MASHEIDYPGMIESALRGVVRDLLAWVAEEGLPGDHHFYFTFHTDHPDVEMSAPLRDVYPAEMTIILQHQFWDLVVEEDAFEVTLRFGGAPHRLRVPYAALKTFVDPAAEFGLRFEPEESPEGELGSTVTEAFQVTGDDEPDESSPPGEVVSLDDFRKKEE